MELPFLKNKRNNQGGGPTIEVERQPDGYNSKNLLEGIADELLTAIEKKDFAGIRDSIKAFCLTVKAQDELHDAEPGE